MVLSGVKIKVDISAKTRKKLIEACRRRTEANCPVVSIFKESIPIEVKLTTKTVEQ